MIDLNGKTALITGSSRGIGAETARLFAQLGANVTLCARSAGDIDAVAKDITETGGSAIAIATDVSDYSAVAAAVSQTVETFGSLDIVINNAGMLEPVERLENATADAWARIIDVNVNGVFYGIRAALPIMKAAGGGTIISIGSGAATSALEGWSHYCASKAAVHHLNTCLHAEEGENGIRALVLSPGTVATEMQNVIRKSGVNPVSQIPWENHISPEWVAKCLHWMCDADADNWLGQVVSLRDETVRSKIGLT